MKRFLSLVTILMPLLTLAQGVEFEQGLSWHQIKQKAKEENKYIFVDCSASWCVPCKKMEKEVFRLKNVGDYMNEHFISVHVQMDTSKNDDENIKTWYVDAHNLQQQFNVTAFPSYLFFAPDGRPVHRYLAAMYDSVFLALAAQALDTSKQYYTLLENYKSGKKNFQKLGYLASISQKIGDDSLANTLAKDYLHYLNTLPEKDLYQKKYFDFASDFPKVISSKDKIFQLLLKDGKRVNELMNRKRFSQSTILSAIGLQVTDRKLWANNKPLSSTPDWKQIKKEIQKKFPDQHYAGLGLLFAQTKWYAKIKDTAALVKYYTKLFDDYGLDVASGGQVNDVIYSFIFSHCTNRDTLNKALHWMEIVNKDHSDDQANLDTYANLLYKVGRVKEAIEWEEKASRLEDEAAVKEKRDADSSFKETLDKMKKGLPTW